MCTTLVCTVAPGEVIWIDFGRALARRSKRSTRLAGRRLRSSVSIVMHLLGALPARGAEPDVEHVMLAAEIDADRDVEGPVSDPASRAP